MKTDKRPFYNWMMVLLINIGINGLFALLELYPFGDTSKSLQDILVNEESVAILLISIFISVVPILISRLKSRKKNYFGYGIPALLLLSIIYFVWDYYTCTGKFCQLDAMGWGLMSMFSAFVFITFYIIGIYSRKWSSKFILLLSLLVPVLLVGSIWLLIDNPQILDIFPA